MNAVKYRAFDFLQAKKVRSYRVNLEQLNTKAAKEVLVQGKTPAEALQAAQQAGRIPPGFQGFPYRK